MKKLLTYLLVLLLSLPAAASEVQSEPQEAGSFDMEEYLYGHVRDAYEWHITTVNGRHISIPLPVILVSRCGNGFHCFLSSRLEEGEYLGFMMAPKGSRYESKIVEKGPDGEFVRPLDFSMTKNVCSLLIASALLLFLVLSTARWYKRHDASKTAPRGLSGVMEMLVSMVENDIIRPSVGKDYKRYSPYLLTAFFFIFIKKKVQQVLYIGFLLDCFHKTGVRFFLRCAGRMVGLPFFQQIIIIGQYAITPLPVLPKLLCLGFLPDIPPAGRGLTVIDQAKVLCQFLRRFFGREVKELCGKVDHIPICTAAKTVEPLVYLHAGVLIIVKGTAGHAVPSDLNPIPFCGFPDGDRLLDRLKYICAHRQSAFGLGMGGLYPAALARSLAALRRWLLYGSRTDTQRLGTVKLCLSFLQTCSGYFWERRVSFSISFRSWV